MGILFLINPSGELVEVLPSHLDKLPIDTFFLYLGIEYIINQAVACEFVSPWGHKFKMTVSLMIRNGFCLKFDESTVKN